MTTQPGDNSQVLGFPKSMSNITPNNHMTSMGDSLKVTQLQKESETSIKEITNPTQENYQMQMAKQANPQNSLGSEYISSERTKTKDNASPTNNASPTPDTPTNNDDMNNNQISIDKLDIISKSHSNLTPDEPINVQPMNILNFERRNKIIKANEHHTRFNKRRVYLREFDLDIEAMMTDFKKYFVKKSIEFKKQITTLDLVFIVFLEITCNQDDDLEFKIEPSIDEENSMPEEIAKFESYSFKQVKLKEQNFLKLLKEVSHNFADKKLDCNR